MAQDRERSKGAHYAAIPLADGGVEHRTAEGTQARERLGNYLRNIGKFLCFSVLFEQNVL